MNAFKRKSPVSKLRQGATAIEFALTAPILFALVFGAVELGHANMVLNTAEAACYEGARVGILPGATVAECEQATRNKLTALKIKNATIQVSPANLSNFSPTVTIKVVVPYANNALTFPFFTKNVVVQRECTLTREKA
ncbi:MAG: TadE/TadG family type IV pilus assembly protein [Pirellulales bacterium]